MPTAEKARRIILTVSVLPFTDACPLCNSTFSKIADDMVVAGRASRLPLSEFVACPLVQLDALRAPAGTSFTASRPSIASNSHGASKGMTQSNKRSSKNERAEGKSSNRRMKRWNRSLLARLKSPPT